MGDFGKRAHPGEMTRPARNSLAYRLRKKEAARNLTAAETRWLKVKRELYDSPLAPEPEPEPAPPPKAPRSSGTVPAIPAKSADFLPAEKDVGPPVVSSVVPFTEVVPKAAPTVEIVAPEPAPEQLAAPDAEASAPESGPDTEELAGDMFDRIKARRAAGPASPAPVSFDDATAQFEALEGQDDISDEDAQALVETTFGGMDREDVADYCGDAAKAWMLECHNATKAAGTGVPLPRALIIGLFAPACKGLAMRHLPTDLGALETPAAVMGLGYSWMQMKKARAVLPDDWNASPENTSEHMRSELADAQAAAKKAAANEVDHQGDDIDDIDDIDDD